MGSLGRELPTGIDLNTYIQMAGPESLAGQAVSAWIVPLNSRGFVILRIAFIYVLARTGQFVLYHI
jgi:hypothetical protein